MYMTYIIQSQVSHRYYTGSTEDLKNRLEEHNAGETKSTRKGIPWKIVHVEEFQTRAEAIKKEKLIKDRGAKRYLDMMSKSG
jgi:putative endonuclease